MLEIPVRYVDLCRSGGIDVEASSGDAWQPEAMDTALALALADVQGVNGLNFRTGEFAVRTQWSQITGPLKKTAVLAVAVVLMLIAYTVIDSRAMMRQRDGFNRRIVQVFQGMFPEVQRIVDPVHQLKVKMEQVRNSGGLPADVRQYVPRIDILDAISRAIPSAISATFNRMLIADDAVMISGSTGAFNAVDEIKSRLEALEMIGSVTITSANIEKADNTVQFRLKVSLAPGGTAPEPVQ